LITEYYLDLIDKKRDIDLQRLELVKKQLLLCLSLFEKIKSLDHSELEKKRILKEEFDFIYQGILKIIDQKAIYLINDNNQYKEI